MAKFENYYRGPDEPINLRTREVSSVSGLDERVCKEIQEELRCQAIESARSALEAGRLIVL